jgi:hypothetical protein
MIEATVKLKTLKKKSTLGLGPTCPVAGVHVPCICAALGWPAGCVNRGSQPPPIPVGPVVWTETGGGRRGRMQKEFLLKFFKSFQTKCFPYRPGGCSNIFSR